jgi:hypothetical protein
MNIHDTQDKVIRVIRSCNNHDQLDGANRMALRWRDMLMEAHSEYEYDILIDCAIELNEVFNNKVNQLTPLP